MKQRAAILMLTLSLVVWFRDEKKMTFESQEGKPMTWTESADKSWIIVKDGAKTAAAFDTFMVKGVYYATETSTAQAVTQTAK